MKRMFMWAGLAFFALAAVMLYWQLSKFSLSDIWASLSNIPMHNLVLACVATFGSYIALSCYDYLALRYVGRMVSWWRWLLAGMVGFAVSNNAGHAMISGGSIRYRLYTRWRIKASEIVKMITFSGFTYLMGCVSTVTVSYFLVPKDAFGGDVIAGYGIDLLMLFCAGFLLLYFGAAFFYRKTIKIKGLRFKVPTPGTALRQSLIGMTDSVFAGLALYALLSSFVEIPFITFIGIFVMAQVVGVFSPVPGGIGVFETIFMLAMSNFGNPSAIFAALIAYRIIYFLIPLVGIGGMFVLYEHNLRQRVKGWVSEAKARAARVSTRIHNVHIPRPHLPTFKRRGVRRGRK